MADPPGTRNPGGDDDDPVTELLQIPDSEAPSLSGTVVMHGDAPAPAPKDPFTGTIVLTEEDVEPSIARPLPFPARPAPPDPFGAPTNSPVASPPVASAPPDPFAGPPKDPFAGTMVMTGAQAAAAAYGGKLPFDPTQKPVLPPRPLILRAPKDPFAGTMALTGEQAPAGPALPFAEAKPSLAATPVEVRAPEPAAVDEAAAPAPEQVVAAPAARFFHELPRREIEPKLPAQAPAERPPPIPARRGDAVPFLFEHDAGKRGPIAGFTMAWQLRPPKDSITVALKATGDLVEDAPASLRKEADFPSGDVFYGGDPQKGLVYPSDFTLFKTRADVVLLGHAYPDESGTRGEVRFRFGDPRAGGFERSIHVFGERRWHRTGLTPKPTEPLAFEKIRLIHVNAFGGAGFDPNPAGTGFVPRGAPLGALLPHLEDPAHPLGSPTDTPDPACFAPIAMTWKERWSKLGSHDERWLKERWPYFPDDMDPGLFQAAPRPLQLESVRGDEGFEIAGVHPALPVMRGRLPGKRVRCFAQRTTEAGGELGEVKLRLDTVVFDTDARRIDLLWRGVLEVSADNAPEVALFFVIVEESGEPEITLEDAQKRLHAVLRRAGESGPTSGGRAAAAALDEAQREADAVMRKTAEQSREAELRAAEGKEKLRERLRSRGVSEAEIGKVLDPGEAPKPPPSPDPKELGDRLRRAGVEEEQIAAMMAQIEARQRSAAPAPGSPEATRSAEDGRAKVIRLLAENRPLDGLDLAGADLSELDLTGRSLARANLKDARLVKTRLAGAKLTAAALSGADLGEALLDGADLSGADLFGAKLRGASLTGANLAGADLSEAHGEGARFDGVKAAKTRFARGQWAGARFDDAELGAADFSGALLDDATFLRASLPEVRLHQALGASATFDGATMPGARADGTRFPGASFKSITAPGSIWIDAVLDEASFTGAKLTRANFMRASCRTTDLFGADLAEARMDRAKLNGARLSQANLMTGSLQSADLTGADLTGANLYSCNVWKAVLDGAKLDRAIVAKSLLKARP